MANVTNRQEEGSATLWGSRFSADADQLMRKLNDSIAFDSRLYRADVLGSMAYACALEQVGLLSGDECAQIVDGLQQILTEFESGDFQLVPGDEDIHTAIERRLGENIGPLAGKLHTGRSRNDQVATDLRLHLLGDIESLDAALGGLQQALVDKASRHLGDIMPGYTHLQQAQPILFSHWLMSFFWKLQRDRDRLAGVRERTASLPLGSGALAGNPFGIDRAWLAQELGFATVMENSLDAAGDRDFVVEFLAWASLLQVHLSNLAEDLIIWSSREFGFVQIDDAYATGSSLMPQKRNPDPLELMRGKTGRISGHLVGLLTTLKGLPSAYNKDLQEDKEAIFDVVDTLMLELPVAAGLIESLIVRADRMAAAIDDAVLATELADYLVAQGIPFRQSHHLVGRAVRRAEELGLPLAELDLSEYRTIDPTFGPDLYTVLDAERAVEARSSLGGTATASVSIQINQARQLLDSASSPKRNTRSV
jgi:argininosuccinate lyase